jgi:hypothetical protein
MNKIGFSYENIKWNKFHKKFQEFLRNEITYNELMTYHPRGKSKLMDSLISLFRNNKKDTKKK